MSADRFIRLFECCPSAKPELGYRCSATMNKLASGEDDYQRHKRIPKQVVWLNLSHPADIQTQRQRLGRTDPATTPHSTSTLPRSSQARIIPFLQLQTRPVMIRSYWR